MNEEPQSEQPQNERPLSDEPRRGFRLGCLTRLLLVVLAAIGIIVLIGVTFDQGDDARQPKKSFNAGVAEQYARGDLTYVVTENTYIVRLDDGDFLALYDRSSKQQELDGDCRVAFDENAQLLGVPQLPGFEGAFVEDCDGLRTVWRADGQYANGAGYGNLDRFDTEVNDQGDLIVNLNSRSCTRSAGVPGVPPYHERRCGKPD
jgi:hypothetical protein